MINSIAIEKHPIPLIVSQNPLGVLTLLEDNTAFSEFLENCLVVKINIELLPICRSKPPWGFDSFK
jgi:hypothetical protein